MIRDDIMMVMQDTGAAEETTRAIPAVNLNNSVGNLEFFVTIASYFAVFALIIFGFIFFRKYLMNRIGGGAKSGSGMKIKDRLVIAQDKQIIMLEVKDKIMMIGISAHSITALGEFEKDAADEKNDGLPDDETKEKKDGSFLSMLSDKMKTGFDNIGKNDTNKKN